MKDGIAQSRDIQGSLAQAEIAGERIALLVSWLRRAGGFFDMPRPADFRVDGVELWFLPVTTRMPLKFGAETLTSVTCARVRMRVVGRDGRTATGWGETPLSVQWVWPSPRPHALRFNALQRFTRKLVPVWASFGDWGHPLELGHDFNELILPRLRSEFNAAVAGEISAEPAAALPFLAALVANSAFDLALHDAYGRLHGRPTYATYGADFLGRDLADLLEPAADQARVISFRGRYPAEFLRPVRDEKLEAWHLVGGLDPLSAAELRGDEPVDEHPVLLADWIRRDGLKCLKVKLRGTDAAWDYARLVAVDRLGAPVGVEALSADFNCTVRDPAYVCDILDRLRRDEPSTFERLLYVEQPFPYELAEHPIPVGTVSDRKPLFLDESAHDWKVIRHGRELGWTGVALKTCKTQSGALLSACWARAHGLQLMVQDLTNPMLAQVTHALLAAHVPTLRGVETNGMQFYPAASEPEARVHPELYQRRHGTIGIGSVQGAGFGYREGEIGRELGRAVESAGGG